MRATYDLYGNSSTSEHKEKAQKSLARALDTCTVPGLAALGKV